MNNKIEMKMKKNQLTMLVLFVTMLGFTACSDDDKVSISTVGITTTVDTTIEGLQLTGGTYTFENVNTSVKTDITYPAQSIELADGLYNVTFIGKGTYSQNGTPVEVDVQGVQQNVAVSGGSYKLELKVHVLNTGDPDFVIAEIFIPGTYNEAGKQYNGDQYIRIYNNSDKVLYADGLIFMESQFQTTQKYQSVDPDIMDEAIAVGSVVAVPGSGTDYPVQPGESFILCDNAINHKEANPNSIDLSKANFEWYIESKQDVDNPAVPNLDVYYCYSKTIWVLNKQGNRAYAIGRLPKSMTKEKYISDYAYNYTYIMQNGTASKPQSKYKFPNEWVIDAVNVGASNEWQWNVTSTGLDMGHTYIGMNNTVAENIGKCVMRKAAYKDGDRELRKAGKERLNETRNRLIDLNKKGHSSHLSLEQLEEIRIKTQEKEEAETHQLFKIKLIMLGIVLIAGVLIWIGITFL